jgi:hypothetical protein
MPLSRTGPLMPLLPPVRVVGHYSCEVATDDALFRNGYASPGQDNDHGADLRVSPEQLAKEAEEDRLHEAAATVATTLVGMSSKEAAAVIAGNPRFTLRLVTVESALDEMFVPGRITLWVQTGFVTDSAAG